MKPLKIACDIDGVVSDFAGPFLAFFNDRTDLIPVKMSEWVEWSLVDSLCLDDNRIRGQMQKEFDEAFRAYCDEDRFIHQPDIEAGWQMAQALLDGGHDIRYFTHRPPDNASHLYGGQPIVVCTDPEDKATKAAHWGADVFIDDRPENYLAARKAGIPLVILWATPYNARFCCRQVDKGDLCLVASCYDDVKTYIDDEFAEEEDPVSEKPTRALRFNKGKSRVDAIPPDVLLLLGHVYGYGGDKYDDMDNWMHGSSWSEGYASLLRHLLAWHGGEDIDPESGKHHLDMAHWNIVTLRKLTLDYPEFEDRPHVRARNYGRNASPAGAPTD